MKKILFFSNRKKTTALKLSEQFCLLLVFSLFLNACTVVPSAEPHSAVSSQAAETIAAMYERTPYPTSTDYPVQTAYPSSTPYLPLTADEIYAEYLEKIGSPTPYPTFTPAPTDYHSMLLPMRNEIVVQPGIWARDLSLYGQCGDHFEIMIGPRQPYLSYAVENEVSKNQFMIVNITIHNTSTESIRHMFHKQFKLVGSLNGQEVIYTSYGPAGQGASNQYGKAFFSGVDIPPAISLDTYVGFDVDYRATDWKLLFLSDETSGFNCALELDMPEPEFGIRYFETEQAK